MAQDPNDYAWPDKPSLWDIIHQGCGGPARLNRRCGLKRSAANWEMNGIPEEYWRKVIRACQYPLTMEQIWAANDRARKKRQRAAKAATTRRAA